jgi:hypothetical protein
MHLWFQSFLAKQSKGLTPSIRENATTASSRLLTRFRRRKLNAAHQRGSAPYSFEAHVMDMHLSGAAGQTCLQG